MAGIKGKSGGARPGAGRKVQSMRLVEGSTIVVSETVNGQAVLYGKTSMPQATITVIKRGEVELTFAGPRGEVRKLRLWLQDKPSK